MAIIDQSADNRHATRPRWPGFIAAASRCGLLTLAMLFTATSLTAQPAALDPDHAAKMAAGLELFSSDVRAILSDHCLKCHGGEQIKGDFDLSTREKLLAADTLEPAVTLGKGEASWIVKLMRHAEEPHMPHKEPKLDEALIAKVAKWIDLGAPYDKPLTGEDAAATRQSGVVTDRDREFWSFLPLNGGDPPTVKDTAWPRTAIDQYILAAQEAKGLKPNAIADRRKLIRRAYLDLIGLPPTTAQVEAFVGDDSPDAWAKVIDQLLASPHYGERWARHWLDAVRFAESMGFEHDYDRPHAYHYRDFVIKALNEDMPYHQFVAWQLAGDELAPDDPLAMAATGFLTAGVFPTQLTEKEFERARYDQMDDMLATTGAAFLGLTVGCARCHDHKYDPIPTTDYYRLLSTFTTTIRSDVELVIATPRQRREAEQAQARALAELTAARDAFERDDLPKLFDQYVRQAKAQPLRAQTWAVLDAASPSTASGTKLTKQADGSWLAGGEIPSKDTYTFTATVAQPHITAIRIEAMSDPSLPHRGPGLAGNGNFCLGDLRVTAAPADGKAQPILVKIADARATHQQDAGNLSVKASFDGEPATTGWAVDGGGIGKDHAAVFEFEQPVGFEGGTTLTISMRFEHPNTRHAMGRVRLSATSSPRPVGLDGGEGPDAKIVATINALAAGEPVGDDARAAARNWFASTLPKYRELTAAIEQRRKAGPDLPRAVVQVSSEHLPPVKHHADDRGFPHFYPQTHLLTRGDPNQKQQVVTQSFLQVLMRDGKDESYWQAARPNSARTSYRRRSLANWLADVDHGAGHLLARVIANRVWQHHFERGLVATPNDFGLQGERPTHPQLLDHLAEYLIDHDWQLKALHRYIMTSAVYMQGADKDEQRAATDPENRLLWHWPRRRLEAEVIRDSILSISGRLDTRMYGPGTLDESMTRRSIYFTVKRSSLTPMMQLFDAPEALVSIGDRPSTTIAPQALLFMNSPQIRHSAVSFAERLKQLPLAEAVRSGYLVALGREPTDAERADSVAFIEAQAAAYRTDGKDNASQLALADLCQVLISLNEFVYVD